jgi:Uma2 family endonuclease
VKLGWPDYRALPDDGLRHEIIDGEHRVSPTPVPYHQLVVGRLLVQLHLGIAEAGLGLVIVAPLTVQLGEHDILVPDISVLMTDRRHLLTPKKIKGAPNLLIEVLSRSTRRRDRGSKKQSCARNGVPEYWLVDPDEHEVEQWLLRGDDYELAGTFAELVTPACAPTVAIALAKVW